MSAYLKFYELERSPFEGEEQSKVVLGTRALREAFATIRNGLRNMPSYAHNIPVDDRWAIVGYVRALQLSQLVEKTELSQVQQETEQSQ